MRWNPDESRRLSEREGDDPVKRILNRVRYGEIHPERVLIAAQIGLPAAITACITLHYGVTPLTTLGDQQFMAALGSAIRQMVVSGESIRFPIISFCYKILSQIPNFTALTAGRRDPNNNLIRDQMMDLIFLITVDPKNIDFVAANEAPLDPTQIGQIFDALAGISRNDLELLDIIRQSNSDDHSEADNENIAFNFQFAAIAQTIDLTQIPTSPSPEQFDQVSHHISLCLRAFIFDCLQCVRQMQVYAANPLIGDDILSGPEMITLIREALGNLIVGEPNL